MDFEVRSAHVNLGPTLRDYVQQRLDRSLGRMKNRIGRVTIHLDDVNGPKRGADKRCLAEAKLVRSGTIVAEVTAGDFRTAVDEAADRLATQLHRQLDRQRAIRRHKSRQPRPSTSPT